MKLTQILSRVKSDFKLLSGQILPDKITVEDLALDSRLVKKNSVFFALNGQQKSGCEFIENAIKNGAAVIVLDDENLAKKFNTSEALFIKTTKPFDLLIEFLKIFYAPLPANIYAITGTNGKTSTAEFTRQILQFLGKKSASIGTLGVMCDNVDLELQNSSLTTPDIVSLYKNLQTLQKNGIEDVAIEVSSIGLQQGRINGLKIEVGAFTNFTQDHLDYHRSMEEYFKCKMILFENVLQNQGCAVINSDISEFAKIKKICQEKKYSLIEYGFKAADLKLQKIEPTIAGQKVFFEFKQTNYQFDLSVSGDFQAFNALCALGNVLAKNNLSAEEIKNLLTKFSSLKPAAGRMQKVATLENRAQIFIDFAHSPDALKNVLQLARNLTKKRLLVLLGCGGNRDAKKRPLMGEIACALADLVIVSDDNPRHENAQNIRQEILANCQMVKTIEIANRAQAIEKAITMLESEDVLILAGKGHEKYQLIGDTKFEFDEELIVKNVLKKLPTQSAGKS